MQDLDKANSTIRNLEIKNESEAPTGDKTETVPDPVAPKDLTCTDYNMDEEDEDTADDEESVSSELKESNTVLYKISKEWQNLMKKDKANAG